MSSRDENSLSLTSLSKKGLTDILIACVTRRLFWHLEGGGGEPRKVMALEGNNTIFSFYWQIAAGDIGGAF